jgi:dipeptidase E
MPRQIIALGGGGFSMEPDNPALDRYILSQARRPHPAVCFIPTASGDAESYIFHFLDSFIKLDCQPSYLSLFKPPTADLESYLLEKDILYVGGGNTRNALALWQEWGLDVLLRKAYQAGVILSGISAGANCWFEECLTDSFHGEIRVWPCLGILSGSFSPHYDGEASRRPAFHRYLSEGKIKPGLAADDSAAVHFVDEQFNQAVSSKPTARVYRLSLADGQVLEEPIIPRHLTV